MITDNLINQLNQLVDQATPGALETAFDNMDVRLADYKGRRKDAKEILSNLIQELLPARVKIHKTTFTDKQTKAALFALLQELPRVDEYTNKPAVIDYAEQLARKILYAAKHATPDRNEH